MDTTIRTFPCPDGQFLRVQAVTLDNWVELSFLSPNPAPRAFDSFFHIYRQYLVPSNRWVFGNIVMFRVPEGLQIPLDTMADPLTAAAACLRKGVYFLGRKIHFRTEEAKRLWHTLQQQDCIQLIQGNLPITTIIPVSHTPGFLSETAPDARVKVNSSFFIMDPFDCATVYDHIGTPIGLMVKNGIVENPPLFDREALLVRKDGSVRIEQPALSALVMEIGGNRYIPGKNAVLHTRPDRAKTPCSKGYRLVIVGRKVVAVHVGGRIPIPASGFVLCPEEPCSVKPGDSVNYLGLEDVTFGIQVGNSILKDGVRTTTFLSRFYNIRRLEPVPYPPCLYPLDFQRARAARIALGASRDSKPMLLWAEGAGKLGHTPGNDSCGATLADMGRVCQDVGMYHAVNLDGGGSAQLLINNRRSLRISDRNAHDFSDAERPVPMGLVVE